MIRIRSFSARYKKNNKTWYPFRTGLCPGLYEEAEQIGPVVYILEDDVRLFHPGDERLVVLLTFQLNSDHGRALFPVRLFYILKTYNIVLGAQHIQKFAQGSGSLGKRMMK